MMMRQMRSVLCPVVLGVGVMAAASLSASAAPGTAIRAPTPREVSDAQMVQAFGKQGIRLNGGDVEKIRAAFQEAVRQVRAQGEGSSQIKFTAIEMAQALKLDTAPDSQVMRHVVAAVNYAARLEPEAQPAGADWQRYFEQTLALNENSAFLKLLSAQGFSPVKISWEDIGRTENSVWGNRISDVGIWVRAQESAPMGAQLALSVRRDENFRDKILMVPSERIKIHRQVKGRTQEVTLPERLRELGLTSKTKDQNVIVSNQFAIVPVPAASMMGRGGNTGGNTPPRVAFNFSIFPYGSQNFVITDVIEGSSDAVVGKGGHQLLFANVNGQRAPFTASRAEERPDLLQLEKSLKAQGMDVDVQRYYLIQIPLKREAKGVRPAHMGRPPFSQPIYTMMPPPSNNPSAPVPASPVKSLSMDDETPKGASKSAPIQPMQPMQETAGLGKVAIGHGQSEGPYVTGSGYAGARAEEPIRVTVIYFVTPVGEVTQKDMQTFTAAFGQWDKQAIWGGSFVTP